MVKRALSALTLALALVSSPVLARRPPISTSTPSSAVEREARAAYGEGVQLAAEERWVEALARFQHSRERVQRPGTLFNIAAVLIRLGRAQEALTTLDAFQALANPRSDAALLREAQTLRQTATTSLRHLVLRISPAEATLTIDGEPTSESGTERTLTLDPGEHVAEVSLEGHASARLTLDTGRDDFEITLAALEAALRVTSTVEGTSVRIDTVERGVAPLDLSLPPGEHAIALSASGYLPFERTLTLAPGAQFTLDAQLELIPALPLEQDPLFWIVVAGSVVAVGLSVGLGIYGYENRPPEAPYRGTSGVALAPLTF